MKKSGFERNLASTYFTIVVQHTYTYYLLQYPQTKIKLALLYYIFFAWSFHILGIFTYWEPIESNDGKNLMSSSQCSKFFMSMKIQIIFSIKVSRKLFKKMISTYISSWSYIPIFQNCLILGAWYDIHIFNHMYVKLKVLIVNT